MTQGLYGTFTIIATNSKSGAAPRVVGTRVARVPCSPRFEYQCRHRNRKCAGRSKAPGRPNDREPDGGATNDGRVQPSAHLDFVPGIGSYPIPIQPRG